FEDARPIDRGHQPMAVMIAPVPKPQRIVNAACHGREVFALPPDLDALDVDERVARAERDLHQRSHVGTEVGREQQTWLAELEAGARTGFARRSSRDVTEEIDEEPNPRCVA